MPAGSSVLPNTAPRHIAATDAAGVGEMGRHQGLHALSQMYDTSGGERRVGL